MTDHVIGFVRKDVSGGAWERDQARVYDLAAEFGWSVVLVYHGDSDRARGRVINRLMNLAYSEDVGRIIAPSAEHFEDGELPALVKIAEVICADTGTRYTSAAAGTVRIASAK
ncbi:hypothetical protein [Nocardia yamanashiensis]|uniref:hypothetical protein n=1 Tax=Nocardia yamanashiensis TaxID=209247 RepID=UPI000ADA1B5C|nr:hypothetical protein [Nocardia yamanashiensis]